MTEARKHLLVVAMQRQLMQHKASSRKPAEEFAILSFHLDTLFHNKTWPLFYRLFICVKLAAVGL